MGEEKIYPHCILPHGEAREISNSQLASPCVSSRVLVSRQGQMLPSSDPGLLVLEHPSARGTATSPVQCLLRRLPVLGPHMKRTTGHSH